MYYILLKGELCINSYLNIAKTTPIVKGESRYVLIPTSNIAKTTPIVKGESRFFKIPTST